MDSNDEAKDAKIVTSPASPHWGKLKIALKAVRKLRLASQAEPDYIPEQLPDSLSEREKKWRKGALLVPLSVESFKKPSILPVRERCGKYPDDPNWVRGKCENGLKYIIRSNPKPKDQVVLRLVLKVGSMHEEDDQRGMAHFIEHMAFRETHNFKDQEIYNYLKSIGSAGAHINAHTSFAETVYKLYVPNKPEVLERSLEIFAEWARNVKFSDQIMEPERKVVWEEYRAGLCADQRQDEVAFNLLIGKDSRWAKRKPIGVEDVISKCTAADLEQFYQKWYRTEFMTFAAIGDVDVGLIESLVEKYLAPLQNHSAQPHTLYLPTEVDWKVNVPKENQILVQTDKENANSYLTFCMKSLYDSNKETDWDRLRLEVVSFVVQNSLNERLAQMARRPDSPFLSAGCSRGRILHQLSLLDVTINAQNTKERILVAFEKVLIEVERLRLHGITERELRLALTATKSNIEYLWQERNNIDSSNFEATAVSWATHATTLASTSHVLRAELTFTEELGTNMSLVQQLIQKYWDFRTSTLFRLDNIEGIDISEEDLKERIAMVEELSKSGSIDEWEEKAVAGELMTPPQVPGKLLELPPGLSDLDSKSGPNRVRTPYLSIRNMPSVDAKLATLANGIKVLYKYTDFQKAGISLTGMASHGTSILATPLDDQEKEFNKDDEEFKKRHYQSKIVIGAKQSVGPHDPDQLSILLNDLQVYFNLSLGETSRGITGWTTTKDFESLLQLVWLSFDESQRYDKQEYDYVLQNYRSRTEHEDKDPQTEFTKAVFKLLHGDHWTRGFITDKELNWLDFERAHAFYKAFFGNLTDFTFCLVGALPEEKLLLPLLQQYFGNHQPLTLMGIASRVRTKLDRLSSCSPKSHPFTNPKGVIYKRFYRGIAQKATVDMYFPTVYSGFENYSLPISFLTSILEERLIDVLRNKIGGVYSVAAWANTSCGRSQFVLNISFTCDISVVDKLREATIETIARMGKLYFYGNSHSEARSQPLGITEKEFKPIQEQTLLEQKDNIERNSFWEGLLTGVYGYRQACYKNFHNPKNEVRSKYDSRVLPGLIREGRKCSEDLKTRTFEDLISTPWKELSFDTHLEQRTDYVARLAQVTKHEALTKLFGSIINLDNHLTCVLLPEAEKGKIDEQIQSSNFYRKLICWSGFVLAVVPVIFNVVKKSLK